MNATLPIDQFRDRLLINKHTLDDDLEVHASALERLQREVALLDRCVVEAKDEMERVEGQLSLDTKRDTPDLSIPMIAAKVKTNSQYQRARTAYLDAKQEHSEWSALVSGWESRGRSLEALGKLHGQQYFAVSSAGGRSNRHNDDFVKAIRARMSQRRQEIAAERAEPHGVPRQRRRPHEP